MADVVQGEWRETTATDRDRYGELRSQTRLMTKENFILEYFKINMNLYNYDC